MSSSSDRPARAGQPAEAGTRARGLRLDPAEVRRTLRQAGLRARSALSQNFLADAEVLEHILEVAAPVPGRRVLEIGPGLGILTGGLLAAGADVTAVELDRDLVALLRDRLAWALEPEGVGYAEALEPEAAGTAVTAETAGLDRASEGAEREGVRPGRLRLIEGDALDQPLTRLCPEPYDVVANIPYHVTSPILHRLLEAPPRPERIVLMVQREVAERIAAPPGQMSYLSVFVQYHAAVRVAFRVPPTAFEPAPDVDSAVIVVEPYPDDDRLDPAAEDGLWRIVQAGFRERRKMLHNVLARQLPLSSERVAEALLAAGIAPERRPQTLAVGEWLRLYEVIGLIGPDQRGRRQADEQ